jgi:hypothetical protein
MLQIININKLRSAYNNKVKPIMSGLAQGMLMPYYTCYNYAQNMLSNLIRDYRNNNLNTKSIAIFIAYICYCIFFLYRSFSNFYEIYNVGYFNASYNDLVNNRYLYYLIAVFYILLACYSFGYQPLYKRYIKMKLLNSNFITVIDLFNTIIIKNNDKRTNQLYCQYILENQTSLHHINPNYQSFSFNVYTTELNGVNFYLNSYDILEYNIDKLDFNNFQLEYLFFDYNTTAKTYFSKFYNDSLTKNYPKLAKKILTHCNLMNERIKFLKQNTPICDDLINHIITKY